MNKCTIANVVLFIVLTCPGFMACTGQRQPEKAAPLTAGEYTQAGFPDTATKWTATDYAKAYNGIVFLKSQGLSKLPRLRTGTAPGMLKKLFDIRALEQIDSGMNNPQSRFETVMAIYQTMRNTMMLYFQATPRENGRLAFSNEIIAAQVALLLSMEKQVELAGWFIKNNPNLDETRLKGLQKMKDGMALSCSATLITIKDEYRLYEKEDIEKLAVAFFGSYQRMHTFLDKDQLTKLEAAIKAIAGHEYSMVRTAAAGLQ